MRPLSRFFGRPAERTAALAPLDESGGVGALPGTVRLTAEQKRAARYASNVGFVRRSYEWVAWQAARCPLRPERAVSPTEWAAVPDPMDEPMVWAALDALRSQRLTAPDLVRRGVFLDDTVGEFQIVMQPDAAGAGPGVPYYTVRSSEAVEAHRRAGERGFLVRDVPGGSEQKGTAFWVPAGRVYRHWNPHETWELLATSSLLGILDELDTYWTLTRTVRRVARSTLVASNLLWTPAEAHTTPATLPDGTPRPGNPSRLEWEWAQAAAQSINDDDDLDVASVAPRMIKTPGQWKPEMLEVKGLSAEQLEAWREARRAVADALPLSTSSVLSEAEGNHWNEWLGSEEDVELIADRLRRVLDSFTTAQLRPVLRRLAEVGAWDGNPDEWRIGADTDPITRRPDNSANATEAYDRKLIGPAAARREMHFTEDDAPTPAELEQMAAATPPAPAPVAVPVADTQAPPDNPVPAEPAAPGAVAAGLPMIDDRWLTARR